MVSLTQNPLLLIPIVWLVFIIAFVVYKAKAKQKAKKALNAGHIDIIGAGKAKNRSFMLYRFYNSIPILKKHFAAIKNKTRLIYPADEFSVRLETTKTMTQGLRAAVITMVAVTLVSFLNIFFDGTVAYYYLFLGILLSIRAFRRKTKTRLEQAEHFLLKQYADYLFNSLVPAYQRKHGRIDDALMSTLNEELPVMMSLHVSKIYDVVRSPHLEEAAAEYADHSPSPFFTSLVSLIVPIKMHGDKKLSDGKTTFTKGVMNLNKQLNEELLMRRKIDAAFASLSKIVMMGVFAIQPVYWFFIAFFSGTKTFFSSSVALIFEIAIFIITFLCDYLIDSMTTTNKNEVIENSIWKKIAERKSLQPILNAQYRKHFTYFNRVDKQMHAVGNHTGIKAFMIQCAAYAVIAFIAINLVFGFSLITRTVSVLSDFTTEFENSLTPSEEYTSQMRALSKEIARAHLGDELTAADTEVLKQEVRDKGTIIKADDYVDEVVSVIISRNSQYHKIYFKFWYEIIALIGAIVAFTVPEKLLRFKARQSEMGKEDEVNSFNLLAMIFMDMDGVKVETLLAWMERFAHYYRPAITECIIMYPMGQKKALEQLAEYDNMSAYHKFIESLMNIDDVGMKQAFADIEIQQDFYNDKRKADNEILISRKKTTASMLAFIPFWSVIILWMMVPIGFYAYNLIVQFTSSLASLS